MRVARSNPRVSRLRKLLPGRRSKHASRSFLKDSSWQNTTRTWLARSMAGLRIDRTSRMKPSNDWLVTSLTEDTWLFSRSRCCPTTGDTVWPGVSWNAFCKRPKRMAGRESCCCASRISSRSMHISALSIAENQLPRTAALYGMKWPGLRRMRPGAIQHRRCKLRGVSKTSEVGFSTATFSDYK
jgi:hypothetical protein